MKKLLRTASLALLVLCGAAFGATGDARADVKIKTRNTSAGQASEQVTYIKGKRQRTEQSAASVVITQCDLRRTLQLGVPTKTYLMTPFDQKSDANATDAQQQQQQSPANTQQAARRGGIVTSTITATDTGERKKMFGYTARRIKTSMITESSPDACQVSRSRVESDGWYIDAAFVLDCQNAFSASYVPTTQEGGCRDQYRTKQLGLAKLGYPALVTTTIFGEDGQTSFTFTQEVLEISNAVLDNALFEAPADYRQVSHYREIYGMPAANNANDSDNDAATFSSSSAVGANGGAASSANSRVSAKRAGVVRVGVPMTMTGLTGDNVNADALAEAVRRALMSNLNNSTIEVIMLEAQQPQEAESEAKAKECDYILYSTVAHKKGGGGFGGFLKKSAAIASGAVAPTSDGGSGGGAASSLKAKDELTLEYKLQRGEERLLANTIKAKAKSDGEDLISQLAGQAATTVRAAAAAAATK